MCVCACVCECVCVCVLVRVCLYVSVSVPVPVCCDLILFHSCSLGLNLTVYTGKVRWTVLKRGCLYYYDDVQSKLSNGDFSLANYERCAADDDDYDDNDDGGGG